MSGPIPTAEQLQKGREWHKANPTKADELMKGLSAAAQGPAKKIHAIIIDGSKDFETVKAEIEAIKATIPADIQDELKKHRESLVKSGAVPF